MLIKKEEKAKLEGDNVEEHCNLDSCNIESTVKFTEKKDNTFSSV